MSKIENVTVSSTALLFSLCSAALSPYRLCLLDTLRFFALNGLPFLRAPHFFEKLAQSLTFFEILNPSLSVSLSLSLCLFSLPGQRSEHERQRGQHQPHRPHRLGQLYARPDVLQSGEPLHR